MQKSLYSEIEDANRYSTEKYFEFRFSDEEFNNTPEKMEGYALYQYLIISTDNNPFFLNNPADKI